MRLGTLIRRARLKKGKNLRETAEALDVSNVMLGEIERGRRPASWEMVEEICDYLDVLDPSIFHAALTQFHHEVWSGDRPKVILEEQTEKLSSIPIDRDPVELVVALQGAISSMDIAKGVLERTCRIIRHPNCGSKPYEFVRDAEIAAHASMLLEASMSVARCVLNNPASELPQDESTGPQKDDEGIEKKSYVPRISLDFDGVIHSYTSGWSGDACKVPDPPVRGAFEFIGEAIDRGYDVAIFSTRSHVKGATEAMRQWMMEYGMDEKIVNLIKFPKKKPNAELLIDDRGYHFKGKFPSWEYIENFKPWNKGGESDL
jgi:transcriptional regulator with XRE-family HTH domain